MKAEKIVIRAPNWIGDAVLAIPAMKVIRETYRSADITVLARPWVAGLFTGSPFVNTVWSEQKPATLKQWARLTGEIRRRSFDLALLFPNSFESAFMIFLAAVPRRIGYATDSRRWTLTNAVRPPRILQHQVDYYMELVKTLTPGAMTPSIAIGAAAEERAAARRLLCAEGIPEGEPFLVVNPGAAYGAAKRWDEQRFAQVADSLSRELRLRVAIIGSEKERAIGRQIAEVMEGPAALLAGRTTLEMLIGVLAEASLMITNDSGPMHIAAALGTPTVAVFGPTDERVTGPYGPRTRIVKSPVECSPCLLRECPIDHRCMTLVGADDVCRAARELVRDTR